MSDGIRQMFSKIAPRYELVNRVITACLDGYWRTRAAKAACSGALRCALDLCSGTGDMALALAKAAPSGTKIVSVDFSPQMAVRAAFKLQSINAAVVIADAKALPFSDSSFDAITISFGVRNIFTGRNNFIRCLKEMKRVLKDGGMLILLETSQPKLRPIRRLFHWYVRFVVRSVGGWLSGSPSAYRYLSDTILRFIDAEELNGILIEVGFKNVAAILMLFGIVAIHVATK